VRGVSRVFRGEKDPSAEAAGTQEHAPPIP